METKKEKLQSLRVIKKLIEVKNVEIQDLERSMTDKDSDLADIFDGDDELDKAVERMKEGINAEKMILIEEYQTIYDAIQKLPYTCRLVLERYYVLGDSIPDIAAQIGYSERWVLDYKSKGLELIEI